MRPVCRSCGVPLTDRNWYRSQQKTNSRICKPCNHHRIRKWKKDQAERSKYLEAAIEVYKAEGLKMIKRIRELEKRIKELEQCQ